MLRPFCMGVVKNILIGLNAGIIDKIRPGEVRNLEPFLPDMLRRRRISEIERAAAILAKALFRNARREGFKLFLRIDHFGFSLESHPRHERRTMKPLALGAVAMSSPKRGKRRFKFHLPAV